jgi:hypothetical protein
MDKVCKIINGQFSYFLEVDGLKIPFEYSWNAEYFEKHYTELGYKVIKSDEYIRE